jgi:hypothetical protein
MSKLAMHIFEDTMRSEEFQDACEAILFIPNFSANSVAVIPVEPSGMCSKTLSVVAV